MMILKKKQKNIYYLNIYGNLSNQMHFRISMECRSAHQLVPALLSKGWQGLTFGEGHSVWLSTMPHVNKAISISNNPNIGNYM